MNRILSLAVTVLVASGCIINGRGSQNDPGDINVYWTIQNGSCADHLEVSKIRITIPGEELAQNEFFCTNNGVDGIQLKNFAGKTYAITVDAFNNQGQRLFTDTENVTVNGDASVSLDLVPPGSANPNQMGYARLFWTLPKKFSTSATPVLCSNTDITKVRVYINNATVPEVYDCGTGQTVTGATTPMLNPGTYPVRLDGTDNGGFVYMRKTSTLTITANQGVDASFGLDWIVGGTKLRWELIKKSDGSRIGCADAKVTKVFINFQNVATGAWWFPTAPTESKCNESGNDLYDYYYDALPAGDWRVLVDAQSTDAAPVVYTNYAAMETVTVVNGVFAVDTTVPKQVLVRQQ